MNNGFLLTDIQGTTLTAEEKEWIRLPAIFGILLFTRNYESSKQLRELIKSIHQINPNLIILVDQEGGRVQRFRHEFTELLPMSHWGELFDKNPQEALDGVAQQTLVMVSELQDCGVQASLAPVLDLDYGVSEIIGNRSFHRDPEVVTKLALAVIDTMHSLKMPCIGKHFPGHGGVVLDSHIASPVDERARSEIWDQDIVPYRHLIDNLDSIMPAHVIYPAIDDQPTCFSKIWIRQILQKELGYKGLIITDDITMEGASMVGDYVDRANLALEAGCDIVTICNNPEGFHQVLDNLGKYANLITHNKTIKYISIMS